MNESKDLKIKSIKKKWMSERIKKLSMHKLL